MQAEEWGWEKLSACDPGDVCRRAEATLDPLSGAFVLPVFGWPATVAPAQKTITGSGADCELVLKKLGYFARLSILHYLAGAQAVPPTGKLVKPSDLKMGQIYFTGSHVLPLDAVAARFARDAEGFLRQAARFGGTRATGGDAAALLVPLPRLPMTLLLWKEDDEFPARGDLLFDSTCELHVPADILWSVAMMATKVMLLT
jgi:hypothetical protein